MDFESTFVGVKSKPSMKAFLYRFLSNLLNKYLIWEELLKKSDKFFIVEDKETNNDPDNSREKKKPKLDDNRNTSNNNGGTTIGDEDKALAVLDWRTSNGALTQDDKIILHRDLKVLMREISAVDLLLSQLNRLKNG